MDTIETPWGRHQNGDRTPWGPSLDISRMAEGVWQFANDLVEGVYVEPDRLAELPVWAIEFHPLRQRGWFPDDQWCIPVALLDMADNPAVELAREEFALRFPDLERRRMIDWLQLV